MPIRLTGMPPRCASQTIAVSAPCQIRQRSRWPPSWSITPLISARIENGRLRSRLVSGSKISPNVRKSWPSSGSQGNSVIERVSGSLVAKSRGALSPGGTNVNR